MAHVNHTTHRAFLWSPRRSRAGSGTLARTHNGSATPSPRHARQSRRRRRGADAPTGGRNRRHARRDSTPSSSAPSPTCLHVPRCPPRADGPAILCANLCLLPPGLKNAPGDTNKKTRAAAFFDFVARRAPHVDVLILQEVWDSMWSSAMPRLVERLAREAGFRHVVIDPRKPFRLVNSGLAIASKLPVLRSSTHTFQSSAGVQWWVPNGVLHAELQSAAGPLHVMSTHLHAGPRDSALLNSVSVSKRVQLGQLQELRAFAQRVMAGEQTRHAPLVVAGDFNIDGADVRGREHEVSVSDLLEYAHMERILGPSALASIGFPSTYPFPAEGGSLANPAFFGESTCVDHVVCTGCTSDVEVLPLYSRARKLWISDHAAVTARVHMPMLP